MLNSKLNPKKRDFLIKDFIESGATVLDVGCGDGRLIYFLQKTNRNICRGIDISTTAIKLAKKLKLNVSKVQNIETALRREKRYDYVVLSEFIEHIPDPEVIMALVSKIAKRGIIITFPNIGHLAYRLRMFMGRFPECWKWHPGEHLRFWTKKDFCNWISRSDNNFPSLRIFRMKSIEETPILGKLNDDLFSYNFIAKIVKR